ncbi:hypothetical protein ABT095_33680 [Kitasatospora sp. NPDC002227]|uniref:hypothetical protein n=1 Tax=Kitasatospora sp. NPDC002227 TaxID=3154773 RepID=UPI00331943D0
MTHHLTTRTYRTRSMAAILLDSVGDAFDVIGAWLAAAVVLAHFVPLGGHPDLTKVSLGVATFVAMGCLGTGYALRAFLGALADLVAPERDAFDELITASFKAHEFDSTDLGVYEKEFDNEDGYDLEDTDWAIEAAVALGQLRIDLKQPEADLDGLLAGVRGGHLVREIHDVIYLAADRYAERDGDQYDADQARELRETACYLDMASLSLGDKATFKEEEAPALTATAQYSGDDELTF